jgi:hypothetical protein
VASFSGRQPVVIKGFSEILELPHHEPARAAGRRPRQQKMIATRKSERSRRATAPR